ncbi:glycosyl transferase family 51, partial [bacterium]|nr:glycosyl transferase family 51 [bacterium]
QDYFHKSAADLTLAEASFLAAIPQAPGVYSPYTWN